MKKKILKKNFFEPPQVKNSYIGEKLLNFKKNLKMGELRLKEPVLTWNNIFTSYLLKYRVFKKKRGKKSTFLDQAIDSKSAEKRLQALVEVAQLYFSKVLHVVSSQNKYWKNPSNSQKVIAIGRNLTPRGYH